MFDLKLQTAQGLTDINILIFSLKTQKVKHNNL